MKTPKLLELLGYEAIEIKEGFITLPVEDFEKIETALAVGTVKPPVVPVETVSETPDKKVSKVNESFSQFEAL